MLLAAYDARRPTADLDALARSVANDEAAVLSRVAVQRVAAVAAPVTASSLLVPHGRLCRSR
ncbi:MAG TPA: hypothetical protein VK599_01940 [Streptosporangiaceae bacterium]|nr:hypothetical protein [Streptosporangiaceae bacterium]